MDKEPDSRNSPSSLHAASLENLDHHAIGFQPSGLRLTLDVDLRWPAWTVSWRPSRCEGVQLVPRAGLNDFKDGKTESYAPQVQSFPTTWPPPVSPMPSWLHKPSFGEIAQAHLQLCPVSQPSGRNPCLIAHPGHTSPGPTATRPYEGSVSVRTRANRTPHLLASRAHPKGRLARDACRTLDVEVLCQFLGRRGRAISRPVYGAMPRIPGLPCPCSAHPDVRTNGGTHVRACILNTYDTETWVDWCFFSSVLHW